ncbi:dipeptidyl peptidase 1-like [Corticium candelabrum]|uniref:dipeptidyl peptidase 1-like n=1 Tax=Corticium candelabrum TaxID=121492 RepID=UPI002E27563F|nr:dipeptidyl peptidase 1-like [Corticium candelabrum]
MNLLTVTIFLAGLVSLLHADTPANCTYEDVVGEWVFSVGPGMNDNTLDCSDYDISGSVSNITLQLYHPADVSDRDGNVGFWTMVYNQGFEVVINDKKYFAFSMYKKISEKNYTSICDETLPGWSHDTLGRDWACYVGMKVTPGRKKAAEAKPSEAVLSQKLSISESYVKAINKVQSSWTAELYPELNLYTVAEVVARAGGFSSGQPKGAKPAEITEELLDLVSALPESFDWRHTDQGMNFVPDVRNQGHCGSCFAFASMGMLESRLRIQTQNQVNVVFSPQDIIGCSEYSQGCEGGFPYVTAGKYAEDFGVVEEHCFPYLGKDSKCITSHNCTRFYATDYYYVGGYYGACNAALMQLELVRNGPFSIAFEVYKDFLTYKSGIYHHVFTNESDTLTGGEFDPFELVNHGVLVVGYGRDIETGEPYWIIENSWGEMWGEDGFFRIRRGTDECSCESAAVASTPIVP